MPLREVTTYERLLRHVHAWRDGEIERLLIVGPGGTGKSSTAREALRETPHHWFTGRLSPLQLYCDLCDAPNQPVVLDDVSGALRSNQFRDLLKAFCDTQVREIQWHTTTDKLQGRPNTVRCRGPVLLIMNRLPSNDPDLEALLDRFDAIAFQPAKTEIIARMHALYANEGPLIDLIASLAVLPTLRTLVKARTWNESKHLDVIEELLSECGVSAAVATLADIMEQHPPAEWCQRYMQATGLTDRTYRRHKQLAQELVDARRPFRPRLAASG